MKKFGPATITKRVYIVKVQIKMADRASEGGSTANNCAGRRGYRLSQASAFDSACARKRY